MINIKTMKALVGASLVAATLVGSVASAAITSTLKLGSKGAQVKELQQFLNACSSDTMVATSGAGSMGYETTTFGPATKKAVMAFQKKMGIAQVGQTGPATRAAIAAGCGTSNNNNNNNGGSVVTGSVTVGLASDNPASSIITA
ncbi:MAG: peptidoglycan-binding domain-containing protein, partial [Minisyncoccia bacterium]